MKEYSESKEEKVQYWFKGTELILKLEEKWVSGKSNIQIGNDDTELKKKSYLLCDSETTSLSLNSLKRFQIGKIEKSDCVNPFLQRDVDAEKQKLILE